MIHGYKGEECLLKNSIKVQSKNNSHFRKVEISEFCYDFKINHEFTTATGDKTSSSALDKALRQKSQLLL